MLLAKLDTNDSETSLWMSLIRMRNSRGPRTENWEPPETTSFSWDLKPFATTVWLRLVMNDPNQLNSLPLIPIFLYFLGLQ